MSLIEMMPNCHQQTNEGNIYEKRKTHKHNTEGGDEIWRVAESLSASIATIGAAETDQSEMSSPAIHQSRHGLSSKVKYKRYINTKMRLYTNTKN